MHCSSCGKAVGQLVSYCNHCGARLNRAEDPILSESTLNLLIGGILGIPIAGLVIIIGLMAVMKKELGFSNEMIFAFTALSFLIMLAAESVLIWLVINRSRIAKETGTKAQLKEVVTKELEEGNLRELGEPIPSVTESTTQPFEPVLRRSNTK